jgi:hypothetical protein
MDAYVLGKEFSFFNIIIETCHEGIRVPGDPECSSDEEIDKWMKGKQM